MNLFFTHIQAQLLGISESLAYLLPEYILVGGIIALFLIAIINKREASKMPLWSVLAVILLEIISIFITQTPTKSLFSDMIERGGVTDLLKIIFAVLFLLNVALQEWIKSQKTEKTVEKGEHYGIWLSLLLGANLLLMAKNWLMIIVSMECISLNSYLLTGFFKQERDKTEAAVKYVLFGAFSSATMIYGISWWYGSIGNLSLETNIVAQNLNLLTIPTQIMLFSLILVGIFFKTGLVPLHFWTPDIYEGVSYPTASLFSGIPKIAGFFLMWRFLHAIAGANSFPFMLILLAVIAALSMSWGNLVALLQTKTKRLLAYSGIAHSGFILMALLPTYHAEITLSDNAFVFYLIFYALINAATFWAAGFLENYIGSDETIYYQGLANKIPWITVSFAIFLLALTGLPPTAGFITKWYAMLGVWEETRLHSSPIWLFLLIVAAINTVISLFYYLRIPAAMVFKPLHQKISFADLKNKEFAFGIMAILAVLTLVFGVYGFDALMSYLSVLWKDGALS